MAKDVNRSDYEGRDLEVLSDVPNYYAWIMESFQPFLRGRALEIGAGIGTFSHHLLPHVASLDVLEPSQHLVPVLQSTFKNTEKASVHSQSLEDFLQHNQQNYDVIVMVNVLEHIEDDKAALQGLWQRLNPGGHLLIYVPALPFLYSQFDRQIGHFRRYTRPVLRECLEAASFQILKIRYMDVLGILPWYLMNTLGGQVTLNPSAVKLYDSVGIPVTKFFECFIPFPLGKNLIAVSHKKV